MNDLTPSKKHELAAMLVQAAQQHTEVVMFADQYQDMSLDDAYDIQAQNINLRLAQGERRIGMKMGLTSKAKMQQMGVDAPIYGVLTDAMIVPDGSTISMGSLIHPKIEPEIAFVLAKDIKGPATVIDVWGAVKGVTCAMEVIDSRYKEFKFTLKDVIADNTSAAKFIISHQLTPIDHLDIKHLGIVMEKNTQVAQTGAASAIYGDPLLALVELVNLLAKRNQGLLAGDIVLAGAATAAIEVAPGDVITTQVQKLGSVRVQFVA